ncbi:LuxR family transcriptional regulator [Stenotrophomonas sp. MYb238]|uniref:LuxR family transcriptional regulator n=1 Tax=Stenotrophomonas sp. MYb238 TaxID=2040281 RepID=UPI001290C5FD|nr:LuxR family transcriptional regulator [Stenotrophomonas sp. MYb238]MQP77092.1 LuxR family transcriptional regulator [Stenotrophomonas sp. MYb238]
MNVLLAALLSAAALAGAPAHAASPAASPLVGQWILDVDSLPMPPEARPKRVSLAFAATPDGRWNERVEILDQNDKTLHSESTLSLDGTPGRASGTYWVDVLAAKMPAPDVLVMQFVYEGIPRSTRVYSLSADGNVMTETEAYFRDGTPVMRTALFRRADGGR